ncbi:MAG: cupin domain-containing protein [Methanomassiliicoccales archaeon]
MKIVNAQKMGKTISEGDRGVVVISDVVNEQNIVIGLREIDPKSRVPKRPHAHALRQVMFVVEGHGVVSNGRESRQFKPGDFLIFEANEEHYFESDDRLVKMVEVRFL